MKVPYGVLVCVVPVLLAVAAFFCLTQWPADAFFARIVAKERGWPPEVVAQLTSLSSEPDDTIGVVGGAKRTSVRLAGVVGTVGSTVIEERAFQTSLPKAVILGPEGDNALYVIMLTDRSHGWRVFVTARIPIYRPLTTRPTAPRRFSFTPSQLVPRTRPCLYLF